MSSPEHTFQSQLVFALDHKTGGIPTGAQSEPLQPLPQGEASSQTNQPLEVFQPHASALLGFAIDPRPTVLADTQALPLKQSVTIEIEQIRAKRREQFEQTGYVPPIAGGSPRRRRESSEEARQQEIARYERKKTAASEVGLSENATWEEINAQIDMNKRKAISTEIHMPTSFKRNKSAVESKERSGRDPYPRWESILHHALNLKGFDFPNEEVAKRIKAARKFFRQQDKERQQKPKRSA